MKKARRRIAFSGAAALLSAARDPKAVSVAESMISAMGGKGGWDKARFLRFDFTVVRDGKKVASISHWWDRYDGRYRVEGVDSKSGPWKAYLNVQTREGEFFVNGARVEGEAKARGLENAYGRFINDTYWLLAPWKVFDPGVNLEYVGEVKTAAGQDCDEIKLSFDGVGLTPKDVYWMDIDRSTHLLDQWKYVLNGAERPADRGRLERLAAFRSDRVVDVEAAGVETRRDPFRERRGFRNSRRRVVDSAEVGADAGSVGSVNRSRGACRLHARGWKMQSSPDGSCGKFHLKDGRKLVFYPVRHSGLRRRTSEVIALAFMLIAAALAATLLAASRAPRRPLRADFESVAIR